MMTNKEKFNYIIDQMVVMGVTGHMKMLPYLNVNNFAREIIREGGVTPGELADRIKQGLLDAGVKDKFDEKTVELLMGNAESLRAINDNTTKQEPEAAVTQELEEKEKEVTVSRPKGRGIWYDCEVFVNLWFCKLANWQIFLLNFLLKSKKSHIFAKKINNFIIS